MASDNFCFSVTANVVLLSQAVCPNIAKGMVSAVRRKLGGSMKTFSACTLLVWVAMTCSGANKLAPDLSRQNCPAALDVIVQFSSAPTQRHHDKVLSKGGALRHDLSGVINGAHYTVPANRVAELSEDPEVAYISPDRPLHGMLDYANPTVNANIARQYGWDGTGIGIALIDSGLQGRPDLNPTITGKPARILYSASFLPNTLESYTQDPLCQAVESAWKSGIVVVVAAGNEGRDNSQGTNGYGTIMAPANDPYVISVGAMKDMRTISRSDDLIASYSSKGPTLLDHIVKPDIVAPGNRVISLIQVGSSIYKDSSAAANEIPNSYYMTGAPGESTMYYQLSGTSMAPPTVSGAAALLLQQNPALTPDQVKARIMKTATKTFPSFSVAIDPVTGISYTSQYDIFTVGAGYLDVWAALNNTDLAPAQVGTALSPSASYDATTGNVDVNR